MCQSQAAASGEAGGAACSVGTPRDKSLWRHWGALHTLVSGAGTREFHHPHPQGVPRDVREPARTKGPGAARAGSRSHRHVAQSRVRQPPRHLAELSSGRQGTWAGCPGGWHPIAVPWPMGKGQFPAGSRICSCLRLDADGFSISGDNVQLWQLPGFGLGQSGEWDGRCCHHHYSECLSQAGHSSGNSTRQGHR